MLLRYCFKAFKGKGGYSYMERFTRRYDRGSITSVSQTLSNGNIIQNNYTYEDYRLKNISHNGFNYSFVYDSFGNITQTKVGSQILATNTYGSYNGNLNRVTYGNGDYIDYAYDDYGNVVAVSQNGAQNFTWGYDSTGNLYSHNDLVNNQKYLYTYDSTGRLVRQSVVNPSSNKNVYDAEYGYDMNNNVNRFTSLAGGTSLTETFAYGSDNLPTSYISPGGITTTYSHDSLLRRNLASINTSTPINHYTIYYMSSRCVNDGDDFRSTLISRDKINEYNYKYHYDASGNIIAVTRQNENTETSASTIQQFTYDELNQLVRADDLEKNCTEVYNYDNGGNITRVTTYPLTWGSLDGVTATSTVNYTYGDTNWKDKLTSYKGQTITYDEIGNPLSYRGYTLTWKNGRQLASLSGNGLTTSYTYDVDGLRTSKTVNGVKHEYYYVGNRLQYEAFGSSKLWFFYDVDGNPSGVRYYNGSSTADYYFVCNWRGDVLKIFDSTGSLVVNYDYDAWGNVLSVTNANGANITSSTHIANVNPLRYRGYYYDVETSMYYLQNRYYDTEVKRFINVDNQISGTGENIQGYNLFAYCFNNPVNSSDSSGAWPKILKELGSRFVNTIKTMVKIAISPLKAITASFGAGVGIGGKASVNVKNVPVEAGAVASITDSLSYSKGKVDVRNTSSISAGISVADVFDFSYSEGYEHSYFDSNCTCSFMNSSFKQKSNCAANQNFKSKNSTLGFSVSAYLLLGFEISISVDLVAWNDELISIFLESTSYNK